MNEKVSERMRQSSVALSEQDWQDLEELGTLMYDGLVGKTTILRTVGMAAVREKLEEYRAKEKEGA